MVPSAIRALFVCGVPASGKSTFGRLLARELGWTLVDLDTLTNPLYEHFGGETRALQSFGSASARNATNGARYRCLFDAAAENLAIGNRVVLVAPFTSERSSPEEWRRTLESLGLSEEQSRLVWLDTPADEVIVRMQRRSAGRDREKLAVIDDVLTPSTLREPAVAHIRLDGLVDSATQVQRVLAQLAEP